MRFDRNLLGVAVMAALASTYLGGCSSEPAARETRADRGGTASPGGEATVLAAAQPAAQPAATAATGAPAPPPAAGEAPAPEPVPVPEPEPEPAVEPAPVEPESEPSAADAADGDDGERPPAVAGQERTRTLWLGNDESMSTATAQRILYTLERGALPDPGLVRPHEMLNYYRFDGEATERQGPFRTSVAVAPADAAWARIRHGEPPAGRRLVHVAYAIEAPLQPLADRRNWVLTFCVDVSGSMEDADKMTFTRRGLAQVWRHLEAGDVLNVIAFSNGAEVRAEGIRHAGGDDARERWERAVESLVPRGGTNLRAGLDLAYATAWRHFDPAKENRVVMLTDANANQGDVDLDSIAGATRRHDGDGVRFSGVGVGMDFNGALLDAMCERGRGAYVFLGSESYVDTLFGELFDSLVEPVAFDMRVRLDYPADWQVAGSYVEQASAVKKEVQPFHFFTGSRQYYLADFWVPADAVEGDRVSGALRVGIEYVPARGPAGAPITAGSVHEAGERAPRAPHRLRKALLAHYVASYLGAWPRPSEQGEQALRYFRQARLDEADPEVKQLLDVLGRVMAIGS